MKYNSDTDNHGAASGVTIRQAAAEEWDTIDRLAQLDSAPPPPRDEMLVAEVDGELRAAVAVHNGYAIADPFAASGDLVDLLRARAEQLHGPADGSGRNGRTGLLKLAWLRS